MCARELCYGDPMPSHKAPDVRAAADAIETFLRAIGRDPEQEPELTGTGDRVARMFLDELCAGYAVDTRGLLAASVIPGSGGVVVVRAVPVTTTCPHHLLPSSGIATIAFDAVDRVLGVGAIAELATAHASRLTLQEHIGERIVSDLDAVLSPRWSACRLVLEHGCMTARGPRALGSSVETVSVSPSLASSPEAKAAAFQAVGVGR